MEQIKQKDIHEHWRSASRNYYKAHKDEILRKKKEKRQAQREAEDRFIEEYPTVDDFYDKLVIPYLGTLIGKEEFREKCIEYVKVYIMIKYTRLQNEGIDCNEMDCFSCFFYHWEKVLGPGSGAHITFFY